jgi:nucleotide-binding universal stress UspA family protein
VRVLLAIDESSASKEAVNQILRELWPADTTIRILHVVAKCVPPAQQLWYDAGGNLETAQQEVQEHSQELVDAVAEQLAAKNLKTETTIRHGKVGKTIVEEAKEWAADRIVMGSRGEATLERLLTGSVSRFVVTHAACPVEVVHSKDPENEK